VVELKPGEGRLFRVTNGLQGTIPGNRFWSGEVLVNGNLTLGSADTLRIHRGCKIYFENNTGLFVQGRLQATGDAGHYITFTSPSGDYNPGSWNYVRIYSTSRASTLTRCNIYSASTGLVLENVTGPVSVDNCRIKYNTIGVLAQNSSGSISIQNSQIQNNQTGVWLNNTKPSIKYGYITANSQKGVYLYNQANASFGYENIYGNGEGAYCQFNTSPNLYGSAGYNWIYNNGVDGVSGRDNSYPKLGYDIQSKYGRNHIYANTGYEVANRNSGTTYIKAERNYWSASETNPVPPDDIYGRVDWDPVLPPGPPLLADNWTNEALILEVNEEYQKAAEAYAEAIAKEPNAENTSFAVSGLVRCYEAMGKGLAIVGLLDDLIAKYPKTATEISAKELSLPFLLASGSWDKGLDRAKELLDLNQNTGREAIFLFEMASFYLAKSSGKPGTDYDEATHIYQTLAERFPTTDLALWASIWLKTESNPLLGKRSAKTAAAEAFDQFSLSTNYPNPFNPETEISYAMAKDGYVRIDVYNVLGQKVATVVDDQMPAGYHLARWNGRNTLGEKVGAGIYLCRMQAGEFVKTQKMTLLP